MLSSCLPSVSKTFPFLPSPRPLSQSILPVLDTSTGFPHDQHRSNIDHIPSDSIWLLDSGAKTDLSCNTHGFTSVSPVPWPLQTADGSALDAPGYGTCFGIPDVTHVPSLSFPGLLSTACRVDSVPGSAVIHDSDGCHFVHHPGLINFLHQMGANFISLGPHHRNLYYMDPHPLPTQSPLSISPVGANPKNCALIWHHQLGHCLFPELMHLCNSGHHSHLKFMNCE